MQVPKQAQLVHKTFGRATLRHIQIGRYMTYTTVNSAVYSQPSKSRENKQFQAFINTTTKHTWSLFPGVPSTPGPPAAPAFLARFLLRKFLSSR